MFFYGYILHILVIFYSFCNATVTQGNPCSSFISGYGLFTCSCVIGPMLFMLSWSAQRYGPGVTHNCVD